MNIKKKLSNLWHKLTDWLAPPRPPEPKRKNLSRIDSGEVERKKAEFYAAYHPKEEHSGVRIVRSSFKPRTAYEKRLWNPNAQLEEED